MRLIKYTLTFLIFFLTLACGQNPDRQARNSNSDTPSAGMTELEPQVVENDGETEEAEENSVSDDSIKDKEVQAQNKPDIEPAGDNESTVQSSGWDWWMYLAIFSLVLNTILIVLIFRISKNFDKIEKKYKKLKNKSPQKIKVVKQPNTKSSNLKNLENDNKELKRKLELYREDKTETGNRRQRITESNKEEEKSPEIYLSVGNQNSINSSSPAKKPLNLFAEKVAESNIFTGVTEQKNEHRSVFKLILNDANSEKAVFEIVDTDFILKMAANSPDTYLYPVCKPENSNQNYSGEIITTKRGVAHKVDGKWKVNEEDKATIKFQ